jgi:hypothetical protein
MVVEFPEQIVVADADVETVGRALTTSVWVMVLFPFELVATNVIVFVPAVAHVTQAGFCVVDVAGVPPVNVHNQLVGELVD